VGKLVIVGFGTKDPQLQSGAAHGPHVVGTGIEERTDSSLRRGILHNARQLEDGSWVWRYDRFERPKDADAATDFTTMWNEVESITCPVLLLIGKAWSVVDDNDVARFREAQPTAQVTSVEGAGHSIQGDQPVVLAGLIRQFVEGASS
jgi:pimeloyl-ACP methyl ester carboxylesterase